MGDLCISLHRVLRCRSSLSRRWLFARWGSIGALHVPAHSCRLTGGPCRSSGIRAISRLPFPWLGSGRPTDPVDVRPGDTGRRAAEISIRSSPGRPTRRRPSSGRARRRFSARRRCVPHALRPQAPAAHMQFFRNWLAASARTRAEAITFATVSRARGGRHRGRRTLGVRASRSGRYDVVWRSSPSDGVQAPLRLSIASGVDFDTRSRNTADCSSSSALDAGLRRSEDRRAASWWPATVSRRMAHAGARAWRSFVGGYGRYRCTRESDVLTGGSRRRPAPARPPPALNARSELARALHSSARAQGARRMGSPVAGCRACPRAGRRDDQRGRGHRSRTSP
jgi:hypothetical protein